MYLQAIVLLLLLCACQALGATTVDREVDSTESKNLFHGIRNKKGRELIGGHQNDVFKADELVHSPANTGFDCGDKKPGYYADVRFDCHVFHYCKWDGTESTFACPRGYRFNQETETCDGGRTVCEVDGSFNTEATPQQSSSELPDQIPATSPATTTTERSVTSVDHPKEAGLPRVPRQAVWVHHPSVQHQQIVIPAAAMAATARTNVFAPSQQHQQQQSAVSSGGNNGAVVHLLLSPSPQQQTGEQQLLQMLADAADPFLSLPTTTHSQHHFGLVNLVAAPTMLPSATLASTVSRQGQSTGPTIHHSQDPARRLILHSDGRQSLPQAHHAFPPQFFIDDSRDESPQQQPFFGTALHSTTEHGSRRGFSDRPTSAADRSPPPPFHGSQHHLRQPFRGPGGDFDQDHTEQQPTRHQQPRQPQSNFIIDPEDFTLLNEIQFPGPPRHEDHRRPMLPTDSRGVVSSSGDQSPLSQQGPPQFHSATQSRRPASPQGFLPNSQPQARFPQRFPAESPGSFDFLSPGPPSSRQPQQQRQQQPPSLTFQQPPPFFTQEFPPPVPFQRFPGQIHPTQPSRRPHVPSDQQQQQPPVQEITDTSSPESPSPEDQPSPGRAQHSQTGGRIPSLTSRRPVSPPPSSSLSSGRGHTRFRPDTGDASSDSDPDHSPVGQHRIPSLPPPKRPTFSSLSTPGPLDTTEEFGIPPPTDDFGIKLELQQEAERAMRPSAMPQRHPSRQQQQHAGDQSPPPQFFLNGPQDPFHSTLTSQHFFTPTTPQTTPSQQSRHRQHQRPSGVHDAGDAAVQSDGDHSTGADRPSSTESSEFLRPTDARFPSTNHDGPVGSQNGDSGLGGPDFFRPSTSQSGGAFDSAGVTDDQFHGPFLGQTEGTSDEIVGGISSQSGGSQHVGQRPAFQDFGQFHQQGPGEDNRFSDFGGPFAGNAEFPSGPTFGPQSVDQLAPPELQPFTTRPSLNGQFDSAEGSPVDHSEQNKVQHGTTTSGGSILDPGASRSTTETIPTSSETATGKATDKPEGATTSGRKGIRTRPSRVRGRTRQPTTTDSSIVSSNSDGVAATTASPRRRGQPMTTTATQSLDSASSTTAPRRRKPLPRRKTTTPSSQPANSELNDITTTSVESSTSASSRALTKRRPVFRNVNTTRVAGKRRAPTTTTTTAAATTSSHGTSTVSADENFPASVSHHSLGISRDQLVTSGDQGRRRVTASGVRPKADHPRDGPLEALESKEQPLTVARSDGAEVVSSESTVQEHIGHTGSSPVESAQVLLTSSTTAATTPVTTTTSTVSGREESRKADTTSSSSVVTTVTVRVDDTSSTPAATTEDPSGDSSDGKTEAMEKLRNLLSRKFVMKQTTEAPVSPN